MSSWRRGESAQEEKSSWRKKSKSVPSATASGKYWATGAGSKALISGNLIRLFIALATLVGATVGMVVYLLNTNVSTPLLSIAAVDYEHPWAPNAWVQEDQQRFKALQESSQFRVVAKQERSEETWEQLIQLQLDKLTPGGPGGSVLPALWGYRTLIVHLSAHGVLNAAGDPCLLFTNANALDETTWVPLTTVLTAIGQHKTVTGHDARVLVVLDTGKQPPDIRCGLLTAGFIEAARAKIAQLSFANFAVLLACAEDQCAWTAPEMGGSVFGVMVASGLQGRADALTGNGDARVSVQELARFVASTVDGYVREFRGRGQNPNLIWCGDNQNGDFELCFKSSYTTSAAAPYQANSRIERMTKAWQTLDKWNQQTPTYAAWQRATATSRLARAEQLLWAGAGYTTQFERELEAALNSIAGRLESPWPRAICGGSLAFLYRVHGIDAAQELKGAGLELLADLRPTGLGGANAPTASVDKTANQPDNAPNGASTTGLAPGAASESPAAGPSGVVAAGTAQPPPTEEATPAQLIAYWLTFDEQSAAGQPPPERPELPLRPLAITFLTGWLADNPQHVNPRVLGRMLEWLGPITDSRDVSREEALLRTITEHVQLSSLWNLDIQGRIGLLWSQFLQSAEACELAMSIIDPRGAKTLERASQGLASQLQVARDHIHGCETGRDASDCADDLDALQTAAQDLLILRDRLERGWRLRDELALELPTLAQWIASPISRLQTIISAKDAWGLSGNLSQRMRDLQTQLVAGQIPEQAELDAIDQQLDQLASAYRDSLHDVFESNAKGQRKQLSEMMLSLGLRPSIFRGRPLSGRAELHRGLNKRFEDFKSVYSDANLSKYCASNGSNADQEAAIWRLEDLPQEMITTYTPLLFTELATAQPLIAARSTATSPRSTWAAVGGELRGLWSQLPARIVHRGQASVEAMFSPDPATISAAEGELLQADFLAHVIAQLVPSNRLNLLPNPSQLTQDVCNEQFALWQARRGLADFWKTPTLPQSGNGLFMLATALDWQSALTHKAQGPVKLFEKTTAAATQLATSWQGIWNNLKAGQPPENQWHADLSLASFPRGRAWVRLAVNGNLTHTQPLESGRYQTEELTGARAAKSSRFSFSTNKLPEGSHQLLAWFRGHRASAPITISPQRPPVVLAWQSEEQGDTTIRVNADPKPARIVFVLDCSNSLSPESMKLAKDTLIDLIIEIQKSDSQTEVAVALFGHRVDFDTVDADRYSKWVKQPVLEIHPYNDVEVVQTIARPTPIMIGDLIAKLEGLQKFGRTPLYEAIRQAANLLRKTSAGFAGDLRIVVITDGDDNVLPFDAKKNATAKGRHKIPDDFLHTEEDVMRFVGDQLRLDFVTFNFAREGGQNRLEKLVENLNKPIRRAGILPAGAANLAGQLRKSISGTFSTKNLATNLTIGSRVRLSDDQEIPANQLLGPSSQFEVQIDDTAVRKTVTLVGGETIELQYQRAEGLSFLPHDEGDMHPLFGKIAVAGQPYRAIMLTGLPDSVPQVRICLQSQNPQVQSLRPDKFLLELQRTKPGQDSNQGERVAWTADALWENNHRSPILRAVIKGLPDLQRDRLECRLWLAEQTTNQAVVPLPVARLKEHIVEIAPGVQVSAATEREAGGLRLTLTESREPDAPLVHWLVSPAPDKSVEHHVYTSQVVHEYLFIDPTVSNKIEITATPLPAVPNDSWQATGWIPVPAWK